MNENQNSNQALQVFNSPEFGAIRTAGTSDEPLFCLADVCRILDLQPSRVKQRLNEGGVTLSKVGVQTGLKLDGTPAIQQVEMIFINEPNLYKVIMRSDKPQAEAFQDWVCGEVLPAIRKNGTYVSKTADDEMILRAIETLQARVNESRRQLAIADEVIERQNETISIQQPKADYFDTVMQSETTYNLTEISKDLGFQSVHKFTAWAREHGIIYKQLNGVHNEWLPTSKWSGKGWFTTRTSQFLRRDGSIGSTMQTVVTEQGRVQLHIYQNKIAK